MAARVLKPLTDALKGAPKGALSWSAAMERAFEDSKAAMLSAAELAHPSPGASLSLTTDALDSHAGAVLSQCVAGGPDRPLAFFSVKLNRAPSFQQRVFRAVHELAHPGIRATQRLMSSCFVWRSCAADVARWCRDCVQYSRGKVTFQEKTAVKPIAVPAAKFWHVHVDLVGPLPVAASGEAYLLTVIDRCTRWPEAVPLRGISVQECADAFLSGWVARHGVPHTVTTDRDVCVRL